LISVGADINKEDREGEMPLFTVSKCEKETIIKYLVELGADINKQNHNYSAVLFDTCKETIVKYLVELSADINKENHDGETPIFYTCKSGNLLFYKYLIEHSLR